MAKKCEKCLKEYDDTWGACLLCGHDLKKEEECKPVHETEDNTLKGVMTKRQSTSTAFAMLVIILFVCVLFFIFSGAMDVWIRVVENMLMRFLG